MVLSCTPPPEYFICNKKVFAPGEEHITRICERSVLILMLSGKLCFLEDDRLIELTAGEYYIQRQGLFQEGVRLNDPPAYYYVEFFGVFSESNAGLALRGKIDSLHVLRYVERLCEISKDKNTNTFFLLSYMNRIFGELQGQVRSHNTAAAMIKSYIESEYTSEVTLEMLSKKFGYTEDYINRLFKKEFKISPHRHLINTRLEHAVWLLENTDISVERIASAVGYGDFSSFWRAFKAKYQLSPGEIRHK